MTNQTNTLTAIEVEPEQSATQSVIWLHGLGADGNDFVPIVSELNLPKDSRVRFVFPHAPVMPITINNGYEMRAWFDIVSLTADGMLDEAGIMESVQAVQQLIKKENARGVLSNQIVLAGFSQGGVIAQYAGLTYPEPLAGIIGLSCCLPAANSLLQQASIANSNIPIFLAHGTEDPMIPVKLGEESSNILQHAGFHVTWRTYPMGHSVSPAEISELRTWLMRMLIDNV